MLNWRRVWSGAALAGIVVISIDFVVNGWFLARTWKALQQADLIKLPQTYSFPVLVIQDFAIGFVLTWLYALVRPRLGPGPRTAFLMGTVAWFLLSVPAAINMWLWHPVPLYAVVTTSLATLLECWVGTYLAGWQYLEKAPG